MSDEETPTQAAEPAPRNKGGRPKGSGPGQTPIRHLRVGDLWDTARGLCAGGETMTAFVTGALQREVDRRQRAARTEQANAALTPEQRYPHAVADCGDNTLAHAPHVGCRGTLPGTAPAVPPVADHQHDPIECGCELAGVPIPPAAFVQLPAEVTDRLRIDPVQDTETSNPRDPGTGHWLRELAVGSADAAARHVIAQAAGAAADRVVGFERSPEVMPPDQIMTDALRRDPLHPSLADGGVPTWHESKAQYKRLYPARSGAAERCPGNAEHWHMTELDADTKTNGRTPE